MKVGVFGPRDIANGILYDRYNRVCDVLDEFENISYMLTGGGPGVEQLALRYATERSIPHKVIPPNIKTLGTSAAFVKRNEEIIRQCDTLVVLWDIKNLRYVELLSAIIKTGKAAHIYTADNLYHR